MDFLYAELEKMGVRALALELIRDKDGAAVARVDTAEGPRVLKAFHGGGQAREIGNYAALTALGVPTLKLYASTDRALLMEDILESPYRLGVAEDLGEAVDIANEIAPEHLELCVDAPFDYLGRVRNAGSIFLGRYSPEPVGDYLAGTNHTLPTMGTARFSSPLSVDDFVKKSCFSYYTPAALEAAADDIALFADAEGLHGHAVSATIRREG